MITLKTPLVTPKLTFINRLVMPPMATAKAGADGAVTDALLTYYDERTKPAAVGLVITEHFFIRQDGKAHAAQVSISRDSDIEGLRTLTDLLHANGCRCCAQINHAGSRSKRVVTGTAPIAPSAVLPPRAKPEDEISHELTAEEIDGIIDAFAAAAVRAKAAGFDAVEIHAAHGYLLNQFASPLTNHRTDGYGTDRLLMHKRVIAAVRAAVGDEYPVLIRLAGAEYLEGGLTVQDAAASAQVLDACPVDIIDVSGGHNGYQRPGHTEPGYFAELTEAMRPHTQKPLLLTGGIYIREAADTLLNSNSCDLIGLGRPWFKDPEAAATMLAD